VALRRNISGPFTTTRKHRVKALKHLRFVAQLVSSDACRAYPGVGQFKADFSFSCIVEIAGAQIPDLATYSLPTSAFAFYWR
jgi:hypothetical protein